MGLEDSVEFRALDKLLPILWKGNERYCSVAVYS
jgi:hypothetical protein